MPNPKTVKNWIANSDACSKPGLQQENLDKLKRVAEHFENNHKKKLMCSLVFDEMYIRKQVDWSWYQEEFAGFINFGQDPNADEYRTATQALVYMLNGVNASFEYPVAYYFVDSLKAPQKEDLLLHIIKGDSLLLLRICQFLMINSFFVTLLFFVFFTDIVFC